MAQEEEMRQNLEELQANQEMTSRKDDELKEEVQKKDVLIKQLKDKVKKLESGK
jgi:peptidoglycan hydrolase CwlO-like protein